MILHLVSFRFREGVTDADVERLTAALHEMAAGIPVLLSYVAGPNLHLRPGGMDYAVTAIVARPEDLDIYLDHPAHLAVYSAHLSDMITERAAAQLPLTDGTLR
ncbi:Dabb family protein [Microbacterium sp. NPDC077184]|uniref:Dabb family protein n=1 Tax=Microbacterium sp. NPDC077184 TaxID=3154764 RepID=UPI00343F36C0